MLVDQALVSFVMRFSSFLVSALFIVVRAKQLTDNAERLADIAAFQVIYSVKLDIRP